MRRIKKGQWITKILKARFEINLDRLCTELRFCAINSLSAVFIRKEPRMALVEDYIRDLCC